MLILMSAGFLPAPLSCDIPVQADNDNCPDTRGHLVPPRHAQPAILSRGQPYIRMSAKCFAEAAQEVVGWPRAGSVHESTFPSEPTVRQARDAVHRLIGAVFADAAEMTGRGAGPLGSSLKFSAGNAANRSARLLISPTFRPSAPG